MPGAGDGLRWLARCAREPFSGNVALSAFPLIEAASHAILLQANEILV
jgi:hypothetical protein